MFASIRQYQTNSPRELIRRLNREFVPMISQAQELVEYYAYKAADDTVVSVSVFATEAAAAQSNRDAATWIEQVPVPIAASSQEVIAWH